MAYIGRQPEIGNFQICDAISTVNNQAAYTMQVSSVNVEPETANHMIVSLNGVIQKPNSSYTVAGAVITFATNLVTGDVINFIQILGSVLDLGVPSDDTVTAAKLSSNAVTTAKILDANVTTAKILDNNITTAKILDSNVTTAKVADNAVTLAKMASGTDGNIISYDTSGNPVAVATGSSGQILTSAGAGAVPSFQTAAAGGSLVKLSATTFGTPAAAVAFNNSLITSTYDNYKIIISGLSSASDQSNLAILMSVDNGSSFATHVGSWHYKQISSAGDDGGDAGNKAYIPLGSDEESDATGTSNFEMTIHDVNSTASYKTASGLGIVKNANGYFYGYRIHGYIASTTAVNYIKVYSVGGANLDKGTVTLYGIAK